MPEFVTCPVCGCKVQMPESMFGKRVRCFGCDQRFIADPSVHQAAPPPRRQPASVPRPSAADDQPLTMAPIAPPPPDAEESSGGPFCPGCGRRVAWQLRYCPHCGEEFEEERGLQTTGHVRRRFRRDTLPHRGKMLYTLGNVALGAGAISLCFAVGAPFGIVLGIAVWIMAQRDLGQMRANIMDAQGRQMTETARASAITGLALSLIFAAGYVALFLSTL